MRTPRVVLFVGIMLIGVVGTVRVLHRPQRLGIHATRTRYYCPMHPTFTSDHPGKCPICTMTLVPADASAQAPAAGSAQPQNPKSFSAICYLHNCAKLHEGKPCPMTVVAKPGEKVICPICGSHVAEAATGPTERKILYWTDPMIPGYKASGPGKSPMGMDLVPVYEEEMPGATASGSVPAGYAPVLLTPQKQQLVGVTSAIVQKRALTKTIRTTGTVAHDPELYQAEQEFIQAQQAWQRAAAGGVPEVTEQAKRLVESSRLRLRHLGLSEQMINDVATWPQPDHRLLLGGAGQYWVYASIYEYELPLIHEGQAASIEVSARPEHPFSGTVKAIDPMLDSATRTTRVRIVVEDSEGILKPEMYVNVSIAVTLGDVLAVPEQAVFATGEHHVIFVDKGQGLFEPRDVTVGAKADGFYEVKTGVAEGERVVTSGNFLIDSESRLKGALQDIGGTGQGHEH